MRLLRIGSKWCVALCVGGLIVWGALKSFDIITYGYGVPDFVFEYIGPFTVPKMMWCTAMFPIRFFAPYFSPQVIREEAALKYLSDRCIEKTHEIAQKIVELSTTTGETLLNPSSNICAGAYQTFLQNLADPELNFKAAIGNNQNFFINQFSKILAEENCINAERLSEFAFQSSPNTISKQILVTALEKFKKLGALSIWSAITTSTTLLNTITRGRISDYFSW
jgi:hypothetical protein